MARNAEIVSFLDLLDLDEDVVNKRLKSIMGRSNYSNEHLNNVVHLLQYKQLINIREESDCENEEELNFLVKLLTIIADDNIECIGKILDIILQLNHSTMLQNSEHLLQQLMSDIESNISPISTQNLDKELDSAMLKTYHNLKLCDTILDTVTKQGLKISMPFLETPLENILNLHEKLKLHFLVNSVPKLFHSIEGFNILDRIWNFIKETDNIETSLQVLSCLSDYYLPAVDETQTLTFQSDIINQFDFWNIILTGLMSDTEKLRKLSVYLSKRAIDYLFIAKINIYITKEGYNLFVWKHNEEKVLKSIWDSYFILIDSLEEKQSNIVLPSLQLFNQVKDLGPHWLNCAYNIGLKHDNTQVKLKCIEYRIKDDINSESEAVTLLEAMNDINIYDHFYIIQDKLSIKLKEAKILIHILKAIPNVKWSPVPLFLLSNLLSQVETSISIQQYQISDTLKDILKVPCNNIALRKAVEVNFTYFIGTCLKNLNWKQYFDIYLFLKLDTYQIDEDNPIHKSIQNLNLNEDEKLKLFEHISEKNIGLDFGIIYLKNHKEDEEILLNMLEVKIDKVKYIVSRQYSNKREILNDVVFLIKTFVATMKDPSNRNINLKIKANVKVILLYIGSLLANNDPVTANEAVNLTEALCQITDENDTLKELVCQLYKSSLTLLKDNKFTTVSAVLPAMIVRNLTNSKILNETYKHEMLNFTQLVDIVSKKPKESGGDCNGRLMNIFFDNICEIACKIMKDKEIVPHDMLVQFIDNILECGGYSCLKWIIKIAHNNVSKLLKSKPKFDINQFLSKTWNEIEELKSNSQYTPSMESFIDLITCDELLKQSDYNNIVLFYCKKIIDYGYLKLSPLNYLVNKINTKDISLDQGSLICVLSEILLFSPIIRKEQRILETVEQAVLENPKYLKHMKRNDAQFTFQIHYTSVLILSKIEQLEILKTIMDIIILKINTTVRNKLRYHGNSQTHKLFTVGLQHMLLIMMKKHNNIDLDQMLNWWLGLLVSVPHQPSVRIILEWCISLFIIFKDLKLNKNMFDTLKLEQLAITSQFYILYWTAKHKIIRGTIQVEEFEFVMDKLLANSMGQMFNIRLHAQYLAKTLYYLKDEKIPKYAYIMDVIENTFIEGSKDKNFAKLSKDFFANTFDVVTHYTPAFIYYFLPKYCDQNSNEKVDLGFIKNIFKEVDANVENNWSEGILNQFSKSRISNEEMLDLCLVKEIDVNKSENSELTGTIQKKYIPWKNMSDIETYQDTKKKDSSSELILVASLIDKLPNLGGMARTSEVFGVKTYIVDSLRHLQDRIFQGLSVSAERWVNIEEVRPGASLKAYLMNMKEEGYAVVAAEQTSSSIKLQKFKFPKKTVLLLGHEKEGIPCDLLPIMDYCVEIPQQGFVRSLNVHVTAAIFVWEYSRQNLLCNS